MTKEEFIITNELILTYLNDMNKEQEFFYKNIHKYIKYNKRKKVAYITSKYRLNIFYCNEYKNYNSNKIYTYEFNNYDNYLKFLLAKYNIIDKYDDLKEVLILIFKIKNNNKTLNKHK